MSSRLSSLLVRDGVIGVKRMEKAFQRQVLFGGELDTILLEMNEVSEARLLQYLSLATGLPPASPREVEDLDAKAAAICAREMAERYRIVPLAFEGDALRVLARDPVDLGAIEDLASDLGVPVQPFVAPEFRFELTFDRVFDRKSDERYVRLERTVLAVQPPTPVGKPQTVVVDAALAPAVTRIRPGTRETEPMAAKAKPSPSKGKAKRAPSIPDGPDFDDLTPPEIQMQLPDDLGGGVVERQAPYDTQRIPYTPPEARASELVSGHIESAAPAAPAAPATARKQVAFETSPLTASEARALLDKATHRDAVFEVILRAIRARTWYAAVLTVQGGAAIGRVAMAGDEVDQSAITQVLIPLDSPSNFRQAVNTASPYIGPIATGDAEIDGMVKRMGGVMPPSAMLLPLVLKNRVVALLVGHRGADQLRVNEVSELLPLAGAAGDALGRIIMRGKTQPGAPSAAPAPAPGPAPARALAAAAVDDLPTPVPEDLLDSATTQRIQTPRQRQLAHDTEVMAAVTEEEVPAAVQWAGAAELMAQVQNTDEEVSQAAITGALRRPREVLAWMHEHFPGKLKVDRFELGGRHLRAAQHGPILDLCVRLGAASADLLMDKMRDGRREIRYYAVLCASEIRFDAAIAVLVERLFDTDYGIREVALEGLSGYPKKSLDDALEVPRRALHSEDLEKLKTAATSLTSLADVRAIPELLDVHGRGGAAAEVVGKALVGLTKQDFGPNTKKWRQWWEKNRKKSRIEWLLDGLASRDAEIRRTSVEDLRKATGEYFGFHHDLPRREREAARLRWIDWWNQTGRLRFMPEPEHERHRPTAILPPRRT